MVREAQHKYTFPQTVKNPKKSLAAISKNNSEGKQPLAHSDSLFPHRISQTILCMMLFPAPQLWDASHPHSSVAPGGKTQSRVSPKPHFPSSLAPTHPTRVRTLGSGAAPWAPPLGAGGGKGRTAAVGAQPQPSSPAPGEEAAGGPGGRGSYLGSAGPAGSRGGGGGPTSAAAPRLRQTTARPGAARPRGARRQPLSAAEAAGPGRGAPRSCPRVCAPRAGRSGAAETGPGQLPPRRAAPPPPGRPPQPRLREGPCGTGAPRLGPFAGQRGHQRRGKRAGPALGAAAASSLLPL